MVFKYTLIGWGGLREAVWLCGGREVWTWSKVLLLSWVTRAQALDFCVFLR
jgi:hypothetical protein